MPTLLTAGDGTNGVVITSSNDNALTIQTGAAGAKVNAAAFASDGTMTLAKPINGGSLTLATAQNTTSGTSIDFTGIPSWVKRITMMLSGVSTNSTGGLRIQIGSGSIQASSYGGDAITAPAGGALSGNQFTVGFDVTPGTQSASSVHTGVVTLSLLGSNIWLMSSAIGREDSNALATGGGRVLGSGTLDRVRLTTTNGTDTFDAGSVNILYEG